MVDVQGVDIIVFQKIDVGGGYDSVQSYLRHSGLTVDGQNQYSAIS